MAEVLGFDVSRYEQVYDWNEVKRAGYLFGSTRATVGDYYTDQTLLGMYQPRDKEGNPDGPAYGMYWQGMKSVGILRMPYHVIAPWRPKEQINRFINLIKDDPGELPPVLDLERFGDIDIYGDAWWKANKALTTECVRHAAVELEARLGRKPIIYTTQSFYQEYMNRHSAIEACPLWVANYTDRLEPLMPAGWSEWLFWQYTEGGKIPGINGATDLNRFNGTLEELMQLAKLEIPQPAEEQTATLAEWAREVDDWARRPDLFAQPFDGPRPT